MLVPEQFGLIWFGIVVNADPTSYYARMYLKSLVWCVAQAMWC